MASTLGTSNEIPEAAYEDLDVSTLPQSVTPNYTMPSSLSSNENPEPTYEDLEALKQIPQPVYEDLEPSMSAVPDVSQSEVKAKPVPRPRSKLQQKAQFNNNNNDNNGGRSDSVEKTNGTDTAVSTQNNEVSPDCKRPHPVRPAPQPPVSQLMVLSKPTPAVDNDYASSNNVKPSAVSSERTKNPPPRPERPPPPSIYYGRVTVTQSKSKTEASKPSTYSSTGSKQDPASPATPEDMPNLIGSYAESGKPAVPPRPSLPPSYASVCESSPTKNGPPTPPSLDKLPSYGEINEHPYLDVLPSQDRTTQWRSKLHSEQNKQSRSSSPQQQTREDTDEINAMLRWLKKVSRPDYMTPSVYGLSIEEEIRTFDQRAVNVNKALRLFNLLMMKRNEKMRSILSEFNSISDSLDKLQKKTKTMGIAGGTTGAVGGVTAVVGIALAPVTMGASLIATAVGAGMVASAGGMGAHTAKASKKVVNRMMVEKLVNDYEANVVDLEHCLDYILSGMNELRRHDVARLQRAGAQSEAVRVAHLSQWVFNNMNSNTRTSVATAAGMSSGKLLLAFSKEIDQYFNDRNTQKLKKLNKSKFSGRVRLLAQNLQDDLDYLNHMWELFT